MRSQPAIREAALACFSLQIGACVSVCADWKKNTHTHTAKETLTFHPGFQAHKSTAPKIVAAGDISLLFMLTDQRKELYNKFKR